MVRVDDQGVKEAGAAVDVHFHVFPAAGAQAPANPASASAVRYRPAYGATLDTWSQSGAGHGVTHGVVVQPSFLGTDNGALLAALATMPGRLRGIAVVAPSTSCASMHALDALGVRGIRLNLVGRDHRLSGAERGLVERADSVGWQVEVHVERGRLPEVLAQLQDARTVVVDHFGKPDGVDDTATWAAVERDAGRLHVKLSAPYAGSSASVPDGCSGAATGRARTTRRRRLPHTSPRRCGPGCRTRRSCGESCSRRRRRSTGSIRPRADAAGARAARRRVVRRPQSPRRATAIASRSTSRSPTWLASTSSSLAWKRSARASSSSRRLAISSS
jgi:predicted TIM-barrel fold metal-dependent hydrolase